MRASRGLKWENKMYKLKRSIALIVHSVGVSKYGHFTAQAQESPLNSGATNEAFFHFREVEIW